MIYLFQRIVKNQNKWKRPSPNRLGSSGEGKYVQKNGFGHEDWNFNKNLLLDDSRLYGYCYYQPTEKKRDEEFNIVFATYEKKKWYLIGFYLNSKFVVDPPVKQSVLEQKRKDLLQLGNSLGTSWQRLNKKKFISKLQDEAQWLKWSVEPGNAIRTSQPIEIPKRINIKNYHIATPTEIEKSTFDFLFNLALQHPADDDYGNDSEFPEGREIEIKHKLRERNQIAIWAAKEAFKRRHGKLWCQVCGFDFFSVYGEIGLGYLEGHHILPFSELEGQTRTKIKDIALVCANCHRMLHRKRPWLKMSELKGLIKKNA